VSTSLNPPEKGFAAIFGRLSDWLGRMFVCADQMFCVWLRGWFFVWFGMGKLPSADETLSAFVGRMAMLNHPWALRAERAIDFLMTEKGHCRAAIRRDDND
jgi:hypothetical protein